MERILSEKELEELGDVSKEADLVLTATHLIAMEEHLWNAFAKTGKEKYLEIRDRIRGMRRDIFNKNKLIKNKDPEIWCASKHDLIASVTLRESADKEENEELRKEMYINSHDLLYLFFLLNREQGEETKKK